MTAHISYPIQDNYRTGLQMVEILGRCGLTRILTCCQRLDPLLYGQNNQFYDLNINIEYFISPSYFLSRVSSLTAGQSIVGEKAKKGGWMPRNLK